MNEELSYCGLICSGCPIYLASRETDRTKKDEMIYHIINMCKITYGINYKYDDINDCDGCKGGTDRLFFSCTKCNIRTCAVQKGIDNCAYCDKYACDELNELFRHDPDAKKRLDSIRIKIR